MAKSPIKYFYIVWNEDLGEVAEGPLPNITKAKTVASDLCEGYTYSIVECRKVAEEDTRVIVWKDFA